MSCPEQDVSLPVWREFVARHAAGGVVDGTVTGIVPFGAFVEIDGVMGLLPAPDWSGKPALGSNIRVRIVTLDNERRRMSLAAA